MIPPNVPLNLIGLHAASATFDSFSYLLRFLEPFSLLTRFVLCRLLLERDLERPDLLELVRFELLDPTVPRGPVLIAPGITFLPDRESIL